MSLYSKDFFDDVYQAKTSESAEEIAKVVSSLLHPDSVVDVGCGLGIFLQAFSKQGVKRVRGVDGDWVPREDLRIPLERFTTQDLTAPFRLGEQFDLAVCLEVGEHLPAAAAPILIESLTALAPVVLFSAAIPRQGGVSHLNEQWPRYWATLFAERGFVTVDCIRRRIWENEKVWWWYAQNTLLFVKAEHIEGRPELRGEHERTVGVPLDLVHPRAFLHHQEHAHNRAEPDVSLRSVLSHGKRWIVQRYGKRAKANAPAPVS